MPKLDFQTLSDAEKAANASKVALVTGANSGCGYENCRQLALSGWGKVILGCRNKARGEEAIANLRAGTGKDVFELSLMDAESQSSIRQAVADLNSVVDCVVCNAGKMIDDQKQAQEITDGGWCRNIGMHTMGAVGLTTALMGSQKLKPDGTVIYVSTEATRGIPKFGFAQSVIPSDREGLAKCLTGTFLPKPPKWEFSEQYAQVKMVGTLWMAAFARHNTSLKVFSVSPGATTGTAFAQGSKSGCVACMMPCMMGMLGCCCGESHSLSIGSDRYTQLANHPDKFISGHFYASANRKGATGKMGDQADLHPALKDTALQELVYTVVTEAFANSKLPGGAPPADQNGYLQQ